jgi:phage tail-like protein
MSVQQFALSGTTVTIGRSPDNTIQLDNPLVSRRHAELHIETQGPVLTDTGSANGTFIGGERLPPNQPRLLAPGEEVAIGPFVLIFQPAEQPIVWEPRTPESPIISVQPQRYAALELYDQRFPSRDQRCRYLNNLPTIFQDNEFFNRYMLIFESIWEPLEQREDYIDMYFDPRTCPVSFLPWLAGWLGLSIDRHWPEARRRQLLAEALELYRWRGTRHGLTRIIEVCTGLTPQIEEDAAQPFLFRVRVAPPTEGEIDWDLIEALVSAHKPAHAGYILEK